MAKGIYRRGNIYWIRYTGLDGKQARESTFSDRYREAESLLVKRKQSILEGKQPEIKKPIPLVLFKQLAEEYLKFVERQRSFESKKIFISQLVSAFGNLPLRMFSTMQIEQYQTERLQKGNKPATVNRLLATLKHMFTKAVEWEKVEESALKKVQRVKFLQENNRRLRYLSVEECQRLIEECNDHLKPIVILALNTGMRRGEILNLQWDNIDLANGFILLDKTKSGKRREIPINTTVREALKQVPRRLDGGYLFYDLNTGKPMKDVKRSFKSACKKAGITDFRFHDLRHTFASLLVMNGVDITTVSKLLGHATLTMTLRYAHLAQGHLKNAVDILADTVTGKNRPEMISTKLAQF